MMANTLIAQPNQSMMDLVITGNGTLESGMDFCNLNNVALSDVPIVGRTYNVPNSNYTNKGALNYQSKNGIIIGTLNAAPPCYAPIVAPILGPRIVYVGETITMVDTTYGGFWSSSDSSIFTINALGVVTGVGAGSADVSYTVFVDCGLSTTVNYTINVIAVSGCRVVLAPYLNAVYNAGTVTPALLGRYDYKLVPGSSFVNIYPLLHEYLMDPLNGGANYFKYEHISQIFASLPPSIYTTPPTTMTSRETDIPNIPYSLADFLVIWNAGHTINSVTFKDIRGNIGICAPVIIMQGTEADIYKYWIRDINVEFISSDGEYATLLLVRNSTGASSGIRQDMVWLYDAVGGMPDPLDPTNPDLTVVRLRAGKYHFGVEVTYTLSVIPFTYPSKSIFSIAVEVY